MNIHQDLQRNIAVARGEDLPEYFIRYMTPKRKLTKTKHFNTLNEVEHWCRSNARGGIRLLNGSWQVFDSMDHKKTGASD